MSEYYVYLHRRASDGSVFYVGKGKGKRAHETHNRNNYWKNIAAKHGHTVEIYRDGLSEPCAHSIERILIATIGRDRLCNLTDGGEGASGVIWSDERRAKQSERNKGRKFSDEIRARMSEAQRNSVNRPDISGDKNPAKRPEAREAMSKARRGKFTGDANHMRQPKHVERMRTANPMNNPEYRAKVSAAMKGRENTWMIGDQNHMKSDEMKKRVSEKMKGRPAPWASGENSSNARKVQCIETGEIFSTVTMAADWLKSVAQAKGNVQSSIIGVCKGRLSQTRGYRWAYADNKNGGN